MYTMIWGLFFLPLVTISSATTSQIPPPAARYATQSECDDAMHTAKPAKNFYAVCMPMTSAGQFVGQH